MLKLRNKLTGAYFYTTTVHTLEDKIPSNPEIIPSEGFWESFLFPNQKTNPWDSQTRS